MTTEEKIKKTISELKDANVEIKKEIKDPNCKNRARKLSTIQYGEETIKNFEKVLEEMKNGKK